MEKSEVTAEMVEAVEAQLSLGAGAWDMVDPREIFAAIANVWEFCQEVKSRQEPTQ